VSMLTEQQRGWLLCIRAALDALVGRDGQEAGTAARYAAICRAWKPGTFVAGDVRSWGGNLYRCIQAHDSAATPDWTPEAAPALWAGCHATEAGNALPFVQPQGAHDAYRAGEYVLWQGRVMRCVLDGCTYAPDTYPSGWEVVE